MSIGFCRRILWQCIPAILVLATLSATAADQPPNLIFILVDDQGYYDLGSYGATEFAGSSNFGIYGDVLQSLDYHVGRLMKELTNLGIADNSVVVYASDNGRQPGRNPNQPIRGGKLSTWEGGIRVPCIAWGPGVGVKAGQVSDTVTRAMDWYPTFATLAGIKVPEGRVLDRRDLQPLLTGQTTHVPTPSEALSLNADLPLRRPWYPAGEWEELFTRDEYSEAFFYHGSSASTRA